MKWCSDYRPASCYTQLYTKTERDRSTRRAGGEVHQWVRRTRYICRMTTTPLAKTRKINEEKNLREKKKDVRTNTRNKTVIQSNVTSTKQMTKKM